MTAVEWWFNLSGYRSNACARLGCNVLSGIRAGNRGAFNPIRPLRISRTNDLHVIGCLTIDDLYVIKLPSKNVL